MQFQSDRLDDAPVRSAPGEFPASVDTLASRMSSHPWVNLKPTLRVYFLPETQHLMPSVWKDLQITDIKPDSEHSTLSSVSRQSQTESSRSRHCGRQEWTSSRCQMSLTSQMFHSGSLLDENTRTRPHSSRAIDSVVAGTRLQTSHGRLPTDAVLEVRPSSPKTEPVVGHGASSARVSFADMTPEQASASLELRSFRGTLSWHTSKHPQATGGRLRN